MPVTAGLVTGGAQALIGLGQTLFSGKRKAENNLENYANSYQPNQSIMDYYNKAYARYNPNAYNSQQYQNQLNQNNRSLATGLNAAQNRRGGLGTISTLLQSTNDANQNAASQAEQQQSAELGQLGNAAQMKAAEDSKKYDMKYNLLAMKAGAANATQAAGIQNMFGGLQTGGNIAAASQIYGNGGGFGNGGGTKSPSRF